MEPALEEVFGSYLSWKINEDTWIINFHSNGSLAFLDRKDGCLFVGDELESSQVLMYDTDAEVGVLFCQQGGPDGPVRHERAINRREPP